MKYLVFDTETTGVKPEYNHIVQLAAILTDGSGQELETMDRIIYPDLFFITDDNAAIHGITHKKAVQEGIKIREALTEFLALVKQADCLVAHNLWFDTSFLLTELEREEMWQEKKVAGFDKKPSYCTMKSTTDFVGIGWNDKYQSYKWPRLEELYWKLFGEGFEGAHNALIDVRATIRCFFELKTQHGFYGGGKQPQESGYSNRNQV